MVRGGGGGGGGLVGGIDLTLAVWIFLELNVNPCTFTYLTNKVIGMVRMIGEFIIDPLFSFQSPSFQVAPEFFWSCCPSFLRITLNLEEGKGNWKWAATNAMQKLVSFILEINTPKRNSWLPFVRIRNISSINKTGGVLSYILPVTSHLTPVSLTVTIPCKLETPLSPLVSAGQGNFVSWRAVQVVYFCWQACNDRPPVQDKKWKQTIML